METTIVYWGNIWGKSPRRVQTLGSSYSILGDMGEWKRKWKLLYYNRVYIGVILDCIKQTLGSTVASTWAWSWVRAFRV